ncbi:MAG: 16S rRNA (cytidine(1402)-2'-O)-methyltransferase [Lachnospiraceae bacterium]|nr:16S rRNA (cytidine(1402)-2'-O)-methyltransferase [Lachnospiraceae bacterium]
MTGTLYICATPIGNLADITFRTVDTLKNVDLIAAENTRHSRILLDRFEIDVPLTSYHEHNKYEKADYLVGKLLQGIDIALITDAGTPVISDPGEVLVKACVDAGIPVTSLPGPCACITALTVSGLAARRFCFEGFLPQDNKDRREVLERLGQETRTTIFYEAPHHLKQTLQDLEKVIGGVRTVALCRELTKIHEDIWRGSIGDAVAYYKEATPKGEYVIVVSGRAQEEIEAEKAERWENVPLQDHLQHYMSQGYNRKEAMKMMAADRGCSRREIYQLLLPQ